MTTPITNTPLSYDFDDLMASAIRFMRTQEEWKDYDFEGSGIRQLLRVMTYFSQQQALENNFMFSEAYLDSAQIPNNVASFASSVLGYVPRGITASRFEDVSITVTPEEALTARDTIILQQDARFFSAKDGITYNFSPAKDYSANLVNGVYTFMDVCLMQGIWSISSFIVETNGSVENYVIPNKNIDISTLEVMVKPSETSSSYDVYKPFKSGFDLGPTSKVFFIKKNRQGFYEIEFGDGKIANKLNYGNIIVARYIVTQGIEGNGVRTVSATSNIDGIYDILVDAPVASFGGDSEESIQTTKFFAPLSFEAQGSAVNAADYTTITKSLFPNADSVISWEGGDNDPPKHGYTFISVKPKDKEVLTQTEKNSLIELLAPRNVGSVTPILVDPTYLYIHLNADVRYNPNQTLMSAVSLRIKIEDYVKKYSTSKLERFGSIFDDSDLNQYINAVDKSIKGNSRGIDFERRFVPELHVSYAYNFNFNTVILEGSVLIGGFSVPDTDFVGYTYNVVDNGLGTLYLVKSKNNNQVILDRSYGTVNYKTGLLSLSKFRPSNIIGDSVSVMITPADTSKVYEGLRNTILKISNIKVDMEIAKNV